jgi:hypothetical protein
MRTYIATSFKCKEDFRNLKALLEAAGHSVVHDWSLDDIAGREGMEKEIYLMDCALACMEGVAHAEVFILLARPNMGGAFVELGLAMASGIPIVVLDAFKEGNQDPIFYHVPNSGVFQHAPSTDALLRILAEPKSSSPFERIDTTGSN